MAAYEDAIRVTATPWAPWYVVPADNKWFTRLVVAGAIIDAMERLDLQYPEVDRARRRSCRRRGRSSSRSETSGFGIDSGSAGGPY